MNAEIIQLADEVAALLTAAPISPTCTVRRGYREAADFSGTQPLLTVIPKAWQKTITGRALRTSDFGIDIVLQASVRPDENGDIDPLMRLLESIGQYLDARPMPNLQGACWIGEIADPIFDPEDLRQRGIFCAVLTVSYQSGRRKP